MAPALPKHLPGTPISYGSLVALESTGGNFLCLQRVPSVKTTKVRTGEGVAAALC